MKLSTQFLRTAFILITHAVFLLNLQSCKVFISNKENPAATSSSNDSASTEQPQPIAARPPATDVPPVAVVVPAPTAPIAAPSPVTTSPPVVAAPEPAPASPSGLDMKPDPWVITPARITGATGNGSYYSDKITVTGLSPGVRVVVRASYAGFVDAGVTLTGTYRTTDDAFVIGSEGSLEFKVVGFASPTPGETIEVHIGIYPHNVYAGTFESGTATTGIFYVTTKP